MKGVFYKIIWIVYYEAQYSKKIFKTTKNYLLQDTKIMQIRSRDLAAPQSLKKSLTKNGHTFYRKLFYLTATKKYKIQAATKLRWELLDILFI